MRATPLNQSLRLDRANQHTQYGTAQCSLLRHGCDQERQNEREHKVTGDHASKKDRRRSTCLQLLDLLITVAIKFDPLFAEQSGVPHPADSESHNCGRNYGQLVNVRELERHDEFSLRFQFGVCGLDLRLDLGLGWVWAGTDGRGIDQSVPSRSKRSK